ncbi:hypothetical protein [Rhizobium esperanzae]|uniref:Uncharacterized protein n=1 Tax=Rhizobium esperanzae TaxID=1967781 RepID=A0A7W6R4H6_9HYPH|nr:hypothetical protein [Rhizobium esperanzae]MBB4236658.1 hypothetical protein [Rhizobium esperanzae]
MDIFAFLKIRNKDDVRDLETRIGELDREATAARAEIDLIEQRRADYILAGDHAALDADDAAAARLRRTVERTTLLRPDLVAAVDRAKAKARDRLVKELKADRAKIVTDVRTAIIAAVDANERAMAFYEKCRAAVGDHLASIELPSATYPLLTREMIEPWDRFLQQYEGPIRIPATVGTPAVRPPAKPQPENPASGRVLPPPRQKRATRTLPARVPEGMVRMIVVRNGYQGPAGEALHTGDLVDLAEKVAEIAAKNGAVEFAEQPDGSEAA